MDWMLIGMLFLLMVIYIIMSVGNSNFRMGPVEKDEIVEYQADTLMLRMYYGRAAHSATADLDDFEKDGIIRVVAFLTQPVENEVQRQTEGHWVDAGKAIVRVKKGTNEVVSWTYIR